MTPTQAKSFAMKYAAEIASAVAILGAAGYVVSSPKQQLTEFGGRIDRVIETQAKRDSVQDARIDQMQKSSDSELRTIREDLQGLVIERCLSRNTNPIVVVQLKCAQRLR